jgi:hypothetical protein
MKKSTIALLTALGLILAVAASFVICAALTVKSFLG